MRYGLFALILMLTACETTRDNKDKVNVRPKHCLVVDRCGQ